MKKKNLLIIGGCILLAVLLAVASRMMMPPTQTDENVIIIKVDGKEFARVPLSQPQTVTVEQESGEVNVVTVTEQGAYMASSTCHNQKCVQEGELTLDNYEWRPNQSFIICLPNRVTVELAVKQ